HRAGAHRARDRQALRRVLPGVAPGRGSDRPGRAGQQGRVADRPAVRRSDPQAGRCAGHRRTTRAALPRRADHRLRPGGPPPVLGADQDAARGWHHDRADHALPGRGRGAGGPDRGHRGRPHRRRGRPGHPGRPGQGGRPGRLGPAHRSAAHRRDQHADGDDRGTGRRVRRRDPRAHRHQADARGRLPGSHRGGRERGAIVTQIVKLAGARTRTGGAALPGAWQLGMARGGVEVKTFFRDKMAVAFIFGLPSILLVLLGSIFGSQAAAQGVTVGQLFTAGMIAGGLMSTSFQYLAISIATERENGMLKRLSGTPMPRTAYFAGKLVQVMVCTVAETVLLIAVGMLFYHLHLPTEPGRWWTFAWVFVLGSAACALLGIAASSVPRSSASAMPVITLPFTVLQFISGVYVPFSVVPGWMRTVASFF